MELLGRAVDYTRSSLALVDDDALAAPTPCAAWDLRTLLVHMDDALQAFGDAAGVGYVGLAPRPPDVPGEARWLVETLRARACSLLTTWSTTRRAEVLVGDAWLGMPMVAAAGALEIAVHGWDVARACGQDRRLPPRLAVELYDVALDLVADADRPGRFAGPLVPASLTDPGVVLLAHLGRSG